MNKRSWFKEKHYVSNGAEHGSGMWGVTGWLGKHWDGGNTSGRWRQGWRGAFCGSDLQGTASGINRIVYKTVTVQKPLSEGRMQTQYFLTAIVSSLKWRDTLANVNSHLALQLGHQISKSQGVLHFSQDPPIQRTQTQICYFFFLQSTTLYKKEHFKGNPFLYTSQGCIWDWHSSSLSNYRFKAALL